MLPVIDDHRLAKADAGEKGESVVLLRPRCARRGRGAANRPRGQAAAFQLRCGATTRRRRGCRCCSNHRRDRVPPSVRSLSTSIIPRRPAQRGQQRTAIHPWLPRPIGRGSGRGGRCAASSGTAGARIVRPAAWPAEWDAAGRSGPPQSRGAPAPHGPPAAAGLIGHSRAADAVQIGARGHRQLAEYR